MPADEEQTTSTEEKPKVSDWNKFAARVAMDALWALLIAWVGGTFMFYTYAANLSNGKLSQRGKSDVLFNVQLAQTLCELQRQGKEQAATAIQSRVRGGQERTALSAQEGGASWPTTYYCPQTGEPRTPKRPKGPGECAFPYYWYPGRKVIKAAQETSKGYGLLKYWWEWGVGGTALTENKWSTLGAYYARATALTWNLYRYMIVYLFTLASPGDEEQSPLRATDTFRTPQAVVFLWALVVVALSEVILPIAMTIFTLAGFLGIGAGREAGGGVEPEQYQAPPAAPDAGTRLWFLIWNCIPISFLAFVVNPVCGMLMFIYDLFIRPIVTDKDILMATIQCNQELITLIFGGFVVTSAQATLDASSFGFMSAVYAILLLRYVYKSWHVWT